MSRERQIELAAQTAVGKAPGLQLWIQDRDTGYCVILDTLLATNGGDAALEQGRALLWSVGLDRPRTLYLSKEEWARALLWAMTSGRIRQPVRTVPDCVPESVAQDLAAVHLVPAHDPRDGIDRIEGPRVIVTVDGCQVPVEARP